MTAPAGWEKAAGCEAYALRTGAGFAGVAEQYDERWVAFVLPEGGRFRKRGNVLRFDDARQWAENELNSGNDGDAG